MRGQRGEEEEVFALESLTCRKMYFKQTDALGKGKNTLLFDFIIKIEG